MGYDNENIFAKIIKGDIPCNKVFEDENVIAFYDISPQAPVHILVIPKGRYVSFDDFSKNASDKEITDLVRAIGMIAKKFGVKDSGYRILANHGLNAHQEVPHFHIHLLGGKDLGGILGTAS